MTGFYVVQTQQYDAEKRKQSVDQLDLNAKKLVSGDIFGEIALIYGCRRTASVKAKQYCECAYIKNEDFMQIMANHPIYKSYLVKKVMKTYDDELRIFLVTCLRKIDYLKDIDDEILTHLALQTIVERGDKN